MEFFKIIIQSVVAMFGALYVRGIMLVFCLPLIVMCLTSCIKTQEDYIEMYTSACAENDYSKAYGILAEMQSELQLPVATMRKYNKDVKKKEILYLLEQNDDDSSDRLIMLYEETKGTAITGGEIMSLAIARDNTSLVDKMLIRGYGLSPKAALTACSSNKREIVDEMIAKKPELFYDENVINYYVSLGLDVYNTKKEEIRQIQLSIIEKNLDVLFMKKLNGTPFLPGYYEEAYCYHREYSDPHNPHENNAKGKNHQYIVELHKFNSKCMEYLREVIKLKSLSLANKAINCIRQNVDVYRYRKRYTNIENFDWLLEEDQGCTIKYSWRDRESAKQILREAIKNGEFK